MINKTSNWHLIAKILLRENSLIIILIYIYYLILLFYYLFILVILSSSSVFRTLLYDDVWLHCRKLQYNYAHYDKITGRVIRFYHYHKFR